MGRIHQQQSVMASSTPPASLLTLLIVLTPGVRSSFVTERNPRLFYVSSATFTSLATTQCYIPELGVCNCGPNAAGVVACNNARPTACPTCVGKRRRRALPDDVDQVDQVDLVDQVDQVDDVGEYEDNFQRDVERNSMKREGKFLLYWVTTTSTFTWYTSTSTVASIEC